MFTGLVKYLMKFCSKQFFTKQRSKSRVSIKVRFFTILVRMGLPTGALERPIGHMCAILALFALWRQMGVPTLFSLI